MLWRSLKPPEVQLCRHYQRLIGVFCWDICPLNVMCLVLLTYLPQVFDEWLENCSGGCRPSSLWWVSYHHNIWMNILGLTKSNAWRIISGKNLEYEQQDKVPHRAQSKRQGWLLLKLFPCVLVTNITVKTSQSRCPAAQSRVCSEVSASESLRRQVFKVIDCNRVRSRPPAC